MILDESICNSNCLLCADDLKIFHYIRNVVYCEHMQSNTDSVQKWSLDIGVKLNVGKTKFILLLIKKPFHLHI